MAEPFIRPIRKEDVKQIHEIEKACFAMPWSEESILHDVKENVVARWLVLDDGNGGVLAYAGMWFVLDEAHVCNVAGQPGAGLRQTDFYRADRSGDGKQHGDDHAGSAPLEHDCAEPVSCLRHGGRRVSQAVLRG